MSISCPNKNIDSWKELVDLVGENKAYLTWNAYDGVIPNNLLVKEQLSKEAASEVNTDAYLDMKVPDSLIEDSERYMGFRWNNGNRKYFSTKAELNSYYNTALSNLEHKNPAAYSRFRNKFTKDIGTKETTYKDPKTGKVQVKHEYYIELNRKFNMIIDEVYGEIPKPEANKIKDSLLKGKNSNDIINNIIDSGLLSDNIIEIASLLSNLGLSIEYVENDSSALMSTDGTKILINKTKLDNAHPKLVAEGIIHELVHSVTVNVLTNPQTEAEIFLQKRLKYLYNLFVSKDKENRYGGTSELEFVAELLAKDEFRDYVKSLENGSIWKKFINFIAEFLGIKKGSTKLIEDLKSLLSKEIEIKPFKSLNLEVESKTKVQLEGIIKSTYTRIKTLEHRGQKRGML